MDYQLSHIIQLSFISNMQKEEPEFSNNFKNIE